MPVVALSSLSKGMALTADTTPVLLIVFNRPDKVRQLITALQLVKPKRVYIAADGPRSHVTADNARCAEVRNLVSTLPWECDIHTHFQDTNLGCKQAVSSAISWFFNEVPEGIILEDDCIPLPSFFSYCAELLERYRNSTVMHINGTAFRGKESRSHSYYFSKLPLVWGWASWRRAWESYDIEMSDIRGLARELAEENIFSRRRFRHYWITLFEHIRSVPINTWDAQWVYSILKARGICITPSTNLIQNIGFDAEATHTTEPVVFVERPANLSLPLSHPPALTVDTEADQYTMRIAFVNTFKKNITYQLRSLLQI